MMVVSHMLGKVVFAFEAVRSSILFAMWTRMAFCLLLMVQLVATVGVCAIEECIAIFKRTFPAAVSCFEAMKLQIPDSRELFATICTGVHSFGLLRNATRVRRINYHTKDRTYFVVIAVDVEAFPSQG
jgi:hypothetical protein